MIFKCFSEKCYRISLQVNLKRESINIIIL